MKIVAPVSYSDEGNIGKWVDVILHYGGLINHEVCFLPSPSCVEVATIQAERLVKAGIATKVLTMKEDPAGGWPKGPNIQFYEAVRLMSGQDQPWFWMELDCMPVRSNWADTVSVAYTSSGAKFMGCVVPTPWRDDITKKIVKSPDGPTDTTLCGCAVYPHDMMMLPEMLPALNDFMKGEDSAVSPFDVYLRVATRLNGVSNSPMIDDKWNTENFRISNGVLECDSRSRHDALPEGFEIRKRGGAVSPFAATVHGCKDDSLYNLIMGGLDLSNQGATANTQSTEASAKPGFAEAFPNPSRDESGKLQRLESELSETKVMLRQIMEKLSAAPDVQQPRREETIKPLSTIDALVNLIKSSEKKIRLDQASERLNIPINKLKAAIDAPDSPVKKGALGWLSFAETTV